MEYASSVNDGAKMVKVKKEVILAGGTVGSPQILMLSGVGPKDVLQNAGVPLLSIYERTGKVNHICWKCLLQQEALVQRFMSTLKCADYSYFHNVRPLSDFHYKQCCR